MVCLCCRTINIQGRLSLCCGNCRTAFLESNWIGQASGRKHRLVGSQAGISPALQQRALLQTSSSGQVALSTTAAKRKPCLQRVAKSLNIYSCSVAGHGDIKEALPLDTQLTAGTRIGDPVADLASHASTAGPQSCPLSQVNS